jgi:lysophospholipase L1-like esterase
MVKHVITYLSALCAILLFAGCGQDDSPAPHDFGNNDTNLYVACGDSITEGGYGGSDPGGYPAVLASMLGKRVINQSQGGDSSDGGIGIVNSALNNYKPGYVIILFGANDVIHSYDPNDTINNLRTMIEAAKNNKSIPVIGTLLPMSEEHAPFEGGVEALNPLIIRLGEEEGIAVADLFAAFWGDPSLIVDDGLHPSDAGNQVIARTFLNALQR